MRISYLLFTCFAVLSLACSSSDQDKAASQTSTWDNSYGGVDKSYDTNLLELRDQIAPTFKTLAFEDEETGRTMEYKLFIPANYNSAEEYPLIMFIADASTVGKGVEAPLMQGYGGIIWATDESQTKHPSFVLVPSFSGPQSAVNDKSETTEEVGVALRLLESVVAEFNIDENRLYTTGQSMGGMISFYLNATHPDLFAASLFVGSQWDVSVLKPLADMNFFYIVSAGDQKASKGMDDLRSLFNEMGVQFGDIEFSAKLSDEEKEQQIQNLITEDYAINFVQFTAETVTPEGSTRGGAEHMYSFDYAYQLSAVRDWIFKQSKN